MRAFILAVLAASVHQTASQERSDASCQHGVVPQPDGSCKCPVNLSGDLCQTQECPASDRVFCPLFGDQFCASSELFNHSLCPVMCGNCPSKPDCGSVTCLNGGLIDPSTCGCLCPLPGLYTGPHCEKTYCSLIVDPPGCVASLAALVCDDEILSNVCPVLCGVCAPRCEKVCHNGGTLRDDVCQCACPGNYTGEFCEAELCLSPPTVANSDVLVVDKMAVYSCRAGSVSTGGRVYNSTCGDDGTWSPTNFTCTDVTSCCLTRNGIQLYQGTLSTTNRGLTCQNWTSQSPNRHRYSDGQFEILGETAALAGNYCRDPSGGGLRPSGRLWCYNGASRRPRWDWCDDVPQCS